MDTLHHDRTYPQRRIASTRTDSHAQRCERPLTALERRRVQLASLAIFEREHTIRLAQIRQERQAILAQLRVPQ